MTQKDIPTGAQTTASTFGSSTIFEPLDNPVFKQWWLEPAGQVVGTFSGSDLTINPPLFKVPEPVPEASPSAKQHGGSHYKKYAIQPMEYTMKNSLGYCEGNVIKYITRHKDKGGIEDLKKAKHFIELLAEHFYGQII